MLVLVLLGGPTTPLCPQVDFPELPNYWKCRLEELEALADTSGALVEVSSKADQARRLLSGNSKRYWQSDGQRGQHWIMLTLPESIVSVEGVQLLLPHVGWRKDWGRGGWANGMVRH